MEERIFLDEGGVKVTNARFVTFGKTQALSGITSVSTLVRKPSRFWPIVLIIAGMFTVTASPVLGFLMIALGILWLVMQKNVYIVQLESASGVSNALESKNEEFIFRVVDALNDAIIARG